MAKVTPAGQTINDEVLMHWLATLIRSKAFGAARDWLEQVDGSDMINVAVRRLRLVNERLPIRQMVLDKGARSALYQHAEDAADGMLLVSDSILSGPASLHFVRLAGLAELDTWLRRMTVVEVLARQISGGILMAAPVRSFLASENI